MRNKSANQLIHWMQKAAPVMCVIIFLTETYFGNIMQRLDIIKRLRNQKYKNNKPMNADKPVIRKLGHTSGYTLRG